MNPSPSHAGNPSWACPCSLWEYAIGLGYDPCPVVVRLADPDGSWLEANENFLPQAVFLYQPWHEPRDAHPLCRVFPDSSSGPDLWTTDARLPYEVCLYPSWREPRGTRLPTGVSPCLLYGPGYLVRVRTDAHPLCRVCPVPSCGHGLWMTDARLPYEVCFYLLYDPAHVRKDARLP